jgi:hypothetical protein
MSYFLDAAFGYAFKLDHIIELKRLLTFLPTGLVAGPAPQLPVF